MPLEDPITIPSTPEVVHELLGGMVDYAGLFPPAELEMRAAVENYAAYRAGSDAWALGRFVVPASRLEELADSVEALQGGPAQGRWRLSVLLGSDIGGDLERIRAVHAIGANQPGRLTADAVEFRVERPADVEPAVHAIPAALTPYIEVPVDRDPGEFLEAIRTAGARAKVRTGGITPEAFPAPDVITRFLRGCAKENLPFKATAGLHHPLTGEYRVSYERDSPSSKMYGYLNIFFANALARRGADVAAMLKALDEREPSAFRMDDYNIYWRGERFGTVEIEDLRRRSMLAFGSCSFREPLDELLARFGVIWQQPPLLPDER